MPASKTKHFTIDEQEIALLGRALAHPARVRILTILSQTGLTRNIDLIPLLKLSKTTIQNHIKKLQDADLILIKYHMNSFYISKSPLADFKVENYFNQMKDWN
jgi:DNA-binding transcriptional ArsR family regulator